MIDDLIENRSKKKKKLNSHEKENLFHPYGVLPLGNMYTVSTNCRFDSLGLFGSLEDDTIIEILKYEICSREVYV